MEEVSIQALISYLKGLYKCIYTYETMIIDNFFAHEEAPDVNGLSIKELLNDIKVNITKLLKFKADFKILDDDQIIDTINKLEKKIQRKESEVRFCIQKQNELKVKIEDFKWRIEDLELNELTNKNTIQKLETRLRYMKLPKKLDQSKIREEMENKIKEIESNTEKKTQKINEIADENQKLRELLEEKTREIKQTQREKRQATQKCFRNASIIAEESTDLETIHEIHSQNSPFKQKMTGYKAHQSKQGRSSLSLFSLDSLLSSPEEPQNQSNSKIPRKSVKDKRNINIQKVKSTVGMQRKSLIPGIMHK
ncbi:hypothetical protein SteCoe_25170 [Stentor coeruleus]|uniref:Uncharacterized protein n=1 Tax=Stentor coeruleus TaxID=5963 RepID=A0A1R2BFU9_9CILI|nr:hypothetical protein SteCoe_25170 [Stentor coeruleus]